jgi:cell division protein FtsB
LRSLAIAFVVLIAALQYPMWLGRGGWLQVRELDRQLSAQRDVNAQLKARNDALDADVRDLKTGSEAIEERARAELGMVKHDEVLFQLQSETAGGAAPGATAAGPAAPDAVANRPGATASLPITRAPRAVPGR